MRTVLLSVIAIALSVIPSSATIRYTYLFQNFYVNDVYIDLDLDGDDDFQFYHNGGGHGVSCLKPTSFFAADAFDQPKAYNEGAGLGTYQWVSANGSLDLFDGTDKFLMVKFNDTSGNTYYGWVRILDAGTQYYISGFAYEDVPGQPIVPGATGATGIDDANLTDLRVYSTEPGTITFANSTQMQTVQVQTLDGRTVATIEHPTHNTPYQTNATGVLVFTLMHNNQRLRSFKAYVR